MILTEDYTYKTANGGPWRIAVYPPDHSPVTRDDVATLLRSIEQFDLTPAAKRMIQHGKRARYNYRTAR